jgi:hypothetical protein
MGQPAKSIIKAKYSDSDTYGRCSEVTVTFYTDVVKRKTTAQLHDENLTELVVKVINANLIPDKKINGFLGSFGLDANHHLQVSVSCISSDTFDEKEGKQRALAKVLVRRGVCVSNLINLIAEQAAKSFFTVEDRLLGKMDAMSFYTDYVITRCTNQLGKASE